VGVLILVAMMLAAPSEAAVGVATAKGKEFGVVWSARTIRSLDGGRVFLPGTENVRAVAVGDDGTVYAVRGRNQFGVEGPDAPARWLPPPVAGKTLGLDVIGGQVAWFVETKTSRMLALTADGGEHWTVQKLPPDVDVGSLSLRADGSLDLLAWVFNCHSGDYTIRYRGRIGSNRWRRTGTGPETDFRGPAHYGDLTAAGDRIEHLRRPAAYDTGRPDGLIVTTIDHRRRPLGVAKGQIWRWSDNTRWERLPASF
jgi:hypothetical protein